MKRIVAVASPAIFAGMLLAITQRDAEGCGSVGRPGDYIRIAEESAVIVWDAKNKIEHFIRRAAFDSKSPDFGFLVPTPTVPILAEVTPLLFTEMDRWIRPKTVEQTRFKFSPLFFCCLGGTSAPSGRAPDKDGVRVLAEQKVGGFDSTVLEADNAEGLAKWIKDHGYSSDPKLYAWLTPYVDAKWKITAFKISQDNETGALAQTKPVRMSFKTDRPFFPYREPEAKSVKKDAQRGNTKEKNKPAATEIDGIWKIESAEGKHVANLQGTTFWFAEGVAVGHFVKDVEFTVDPSKQPKWLDVAGYAGIYKLEGDTLHWCRGSTVRPTSFDANAGALLVLRRGQKTEADIAAAGLAARERERQMNGGRLLRVFFVSDTRVTGTLGNNRWHAKEPWSDQLLDEDRAYLLKISGISDADVPAKAWMTAFEDRASPRPGTDDVYFDPAANRTPVHPPPNVRYNVIWIPGDLIFFGVIFVCLVGGPVRRLFVRRTLPPAPPTPQRFTM